VYDATVNLDEDKAALRSQLRAARRAMSEADAVARSSRIVDRLLRMPECADAASWFVYVSVGREVATRGLIERLLGDGRIVAVPRTVGPGEMEAAAIASAADLVAGAHGVPTASASCVVRREAFDVAVIPGIGFTATCDRLGGGLGFYDLWLARHRPRFAVGLAFDRQVQAALPVAPHDVRLDAVVTESRVLRA
jgi:5-formyltetrahydrofolate cyclo-ligase